MIKIHNNQYYESDPNVKYIHPAITMGFDELYNGLMDCVANGTVNIISHADNDRVLFNYNQFEIWDKGWNQYSILARGLILSLNEKRVVALPYPKFFNYGEGDGGFVLPECRFSTYEKVDGSLGIMYQWKGKWEVATRGSFTSDQAIWATNYVNKNLKFDNFTNYQNATFLGEIVYPENKIVVDYKDFEGFVAHGGYDKFGFEIDYDDLEDFFIDISKKYIYTSVDDIVEVCKTLPHNQEGFVVHFDNGYRVKIKGDEYIRIHRLISNVTPLRIWESMMNGDNIEAIKKELPEEFTKTIEEYTTIIGEQVMNLLCDLNDVDNATKHMSDKELGLWIKDPYNLTPKNIKALLFMVRKKDLMNQVYVVGSECRKKVFKLFKPVGNIL